MILTSSFDSYRFLTSDVNNLDGTIPVEMKDLEFLDILNFENNRLRGEIPEEFNDTLVRLRLNKNRLTGTIPGTLSSRLVALYLADNKLKVPSMTFSRALSSSIVWNSRIIISPET